MILQNNTSRNFFLPLLDKMKAVKQKNIDFIDTNEHKRSKEDFSKVSKNSKNPVGAYMNWQFNKSIWENKDNRKLVNYIQQK